MTEEKNVSNISQNVVVERIIRSKEEILRKRYFLLNKTIGISISESDTLNELGFSVTHLKDVMIEVAKYIVTLGGRLAYGGDMRQGGFTELLFELLAYYKADQSLPPQSRFLSFLAWPLSLKLSKDQEADLVHNVTFKKVPPPEDLEIKDRSEFLIPNSLENLYVWARCLTKMRNEMEEQCNARIFIGGRTRGFKGKMPGVLEEVLIAVERKHPIYLVGSYGGVTKDIIDAIEEKAIGCFSKDYYSQEKEYTRLIEFYNEKHSEYAIDYVNYNSILTQLGTRGLSELNGLDEVDNRRLAVTPHIPEMIYLILKGLTRKFAAS